MAQILEIAAGLRFPEGPVALPDGSFLVAEVLAGALSRVSRDGKVEVVAELGGGPNGAAIGPEGHCYVCNNGGISGADIARLQSDSPEAPPDAGSPQGRIESVNITTGVFDVLYTECDGVPLIAPNDLVFDAYGGFYFTDFGSLKVHTPQPGTLYYAKADGSHIHKVAGPLERTNGIGLAPNETTLYVAETTTGRLWAFEVTEPGKVVTGDGEGCGGRLICHDPDIHFDSLAVDSDGHVCVATTGHGTIARIHPETGNIEHMPVGDGTTNICFGGENLSTAYVTVAGEGKLTALPWPCPGLPLNYLNK